MKNVYLFFVLVVGALMISCSEGNSETAIKKERQLEVLPFKTIDLNSLEGFKPVAKNWQIVGDVYVDQSKKRTFVSKPGTGILLNVPEKSMKENLFTAFEHGDIEIELDVMMPIHSNSGLYFQGRYEVQLLDSWGVKDPKHSDIGGIYQRWDKTIEVVHDRGFEGHPPKVNAAKAPGLWQHFKIIFHAPKFDASGNKIKNASFEEVWLNGALLHKNQEVTGPTRSGAFEDEKPMGPLMIQGDHAGVAFRNIKYKLYGNEKVSFNNLKMKAYQNTSQSIPKLDTLAVEREISSDSISSTMATGQNPQKLLVYNGNLNIPKTGDYLFEMKVHRGGGLLLIDRDTIVDLDGDYSIDQAKFGRVLLQQGSVPFTFIYNKHRPYQRGFALSVEGPGIAKQDLHAPGSLIIGGGDSQSIEVAMSEETVLQRGFFNHKNQKRTHVISVGSPKDIHYAFDLSFGSLLQVWSNCFLDVTKMWVARGGQQLSVPVGIPVSIHGDPDFAYLENEKSKWPDSITTNTSYRQLGYELDRHGNPEFSTGINGSVITNKFIPSDTLRRLKRIISIHSDKEIWHKLGEGSVIEELPDNTYAINDKDYFVDFSGNDRYKPIIRKLEGKDELVVKIPEGNQNITYTISW